MFVIKIKQVKKIYVVVIIRPGNNYFAKPMVKQK